MSLLPSENTTLETFPTSPASTAKRTIAATLSKTAEEMAMKECLDMRPRSLRCLALETSSISCSGSCTT